MGNQSWEFRAPRAFVRLALISVFASVLFGGSDLRADPKASLEVVWTDPYNLSPLAFEPVRLEVESASRASRCGDLVEGPSRRLERAPGAE